MRWDHTDVHALVVIPALNERDTVGDVVRSVAEQTQADVLVVDDGSCDDTAALAAAAGAQVLIMPFNVGVGGAMRTAFQFAQRRGYDAVIQVDADGQHEPADVQALIDALAAGANVVVGSRFPSGFETGAVRRAGMRLLAWGTSALTGVRLTDATSGFRGADREAIDVFAARYPAEYLGDTAESLVVAARSGLKISEVPVRMYARQGGSPTHDTGRSLVYFGRVMLALIVAAMARGEGGSR